MSNMTLKAQVVDLTPEMALNMISINEGNRRLAPTSVAQYARMMEEGLWSDGVAVVAVSAAGVLVNGQHVCHAVIKSGLTVKVVLVTGIDAGSFAAFDSHGKRTTGQTLSLMDVSNANAVAAIIRRAAMIDSNYSTGIKISNAETVAIYNSDPGRWDVIAAYAREVYAAGKRDGLLMAPAALGGFFHVADKIGELDSAHRFAASVAEVSGHDNGLPKTSLRRWISSVHRGGGGKAAILEHSAWIKAWNAHAEGRSLAKLYTSTESIPPMVKASRGISSAAA